MSETKQPLSFTTSQYYIDGTHLDEILYPKFISAKHIEKLKSSPLRPDDVLVTCYPKSGTHWLMKIVLLIVKNGEDECIQRTPELFKDFHWLEAAGLPGTYLNTYTCTRLTTIDTII